MATELKLDVLVTKNSRQLSQLADEFDKAAAQAETSGKKIDKTFSGFIDQQIEGTRKELAQLRQEFAKTGNLDLAGQIGGLERNLKALEKIKKSFGDAGQEAAKSFGQKFRSGLGQAFGFGRELEGGFGSELLAALLTPHGIAGAAVVASAAGVTIGGALLTGIGLAGVGAGIAGQLHSPVVTHALDGLKSDLGRGFKDATSSFAEPLARGLSILDTGFKDALPGLKDTFSALAPEVTILAHGASGFLTGLVTGLEHAAVASKPLLDDLGSWLPTFGKEIGGVFDAIAGHQKEALEGLHSIENFLDGLTIVGKGAVDVFSQIWDVAKYAGSQQQIEGYLESFVKWTQGASDVDVHQRLLANSSQIVTHALGIQAGAADDAAHSLAKLNGELSTLLGNQLSVDQANDKFAEDLRALSNNVDAHSRSLSMNSDAGLKNRDVILQLIGDAQQARDAQIKMAGGADASKASVDAANATYDAAIGKIEAMGVKAGFSKKDLDALAGNYYVNVIEAIYAVNHSGLEQNVGPHDPGRKGGARAGGGPVMAGYTYTVDEYGREQFTPDVNGTITPAGRPGGGVVNFNLTVHAGLGTDGAQVGNQILAALRPVVAAKGGNVQRVLGQGV